MQINFSTVRFGSLKRTHHVLNTYAMLKSTDILIKSDNRFKIVFSTVVTVALCIVVSQSTVRRVPSSRSSQVNIIIKISPGYTTTPTIRSPLYTAMNTMEKHHEPTNRSEPPGIKTRICLVVHINTRIFLGVDINTIV